MEGGIVCTDRIQNEEGLSVGRSGDPPIEPPQICERVGTVVLDELAVGIRMHRQIVCLSTNQSGPVRT